MSPGVGSMAGDAALRWLRASLLSALLVLGGLAAHVAAGGVAPSASSVLMLLAATAVLVAPMLGMPASTHRVVGLVMAGQCLVHLALPFLSPSARTAPHGAPMLMPSGLSNGHGSMTAAVMDHVAVPHHDAVLVLMNEADLAMLVGHLAAAVAVGLWLAAGERAAWSILALTGRSVADSLRALLQPTTVRLAFAGSTRPKAMPGWLTSVPLGASVWDGYAVSRRGPPCR